MTTDPVALPADTTVRQAAQAMREQDIGDVFVVDDDHLRGIVTDLDLVVRALADRDDLSDCRLGDVCSEQLVTASLTEELDTAVSRMRKNAVCRIPVVDNGRLVGVLSLGDAAVENDPTSALAQISAAPGNAWPKPCERGGLCARRNVRVFWCSPCWSHVVSRKVLHREPRCHHRLLSCLARRRRIRR
jgi:predicted transcriptional regulator